MRELDAAAATAFCAFLSRALAAARANRSWPDLVSFAGHVAAASPAVHGGLGPTIGVDDETGLMPWDVWARLKADHRVAGEEPARRRSEVDGEAVKTEGAPHRESAPVARSETPRRRYHDALRALPAPRLGDVEHTLRSHEPLAGKGARKLHVVLDKVEASGALVRLTADVTVARGLGDADFVELLFPMTAFAVELTLVRLLAAQGVLDVERVTRGAVDLCACAAAGLRPPLLERVCGRADVCSLSFSTCAADVTPGDNDLLPHETTPLADIARAHLGARALPHRVYRDRKLVVTDAAAATLRARDAGTRTVIYTVAA